jgi:hypothetical protein
MKRCFESSLHLGSLERYRGHVWSRVQKSNFIISVAMDGLAEAFISVACLKDLFGGGTIEGKGHDARFL